jgi:diaminopimelate epimerase
VKLIKAHAYGNDFLLVRSADVPSRTDLPTLARAVCDRHEGIGADGLLIVSERPDGAAMHLLNADGSPSEVSGNGMRCIGAWLAGERRLGAGAELQIDTGVGLKRLTLVSSEAGRLTFRASMGHRPRSPAAP